MEFQAGAAPAVLSEPRVEILAPLQSLLSPVPGPPPTPGLAEYSADRGFGTCPFLMWGWQRQTASPFLLGTLKLVI